MVEDSPLKDELSLTDRQTLTKSIPFRTKIGVAISFGVAFFLYRILYQKYKGAACNVDRYHQITYEANRKLYHGWDNTILGIGQLLMDGWVLFIGIYWYFFKQCRFWNLKNMRFTSAIGIFFLFRGILLNLEKVPFPEDIVWHNPGFFSFSVPYDHTRDFYYSGHTGTLTMITLEFFTLKKKFICIACLVSLVYMINMLTITRIHYSIDIIGALIFAPFWFRVISINLKKFDYFFSFPFLIGKKFYNKCRKVQYHDSTSEIQMKTNAQASNKNPSTIKDDKEIDMNDQFQHQSQMPYLDSVNISRDQK